MQVDFQMRRRIGWPSKPAGIVMARDVDPVAEPKADASWLRSAVTSAS